MEGPYNIFINYIAMESFGILYVCSTWYIAVNAHSRGSAFPISRIQLSSRILFCTIFCTLIFCLDNNRKFPYGMKILYSVNKDVRSRTQRFWITQNGLSVRRVCSHHIILLTRLILKNSLQSKWQLSRKLSRAGFYYYDNTLLILTMSVCICILSKFIPVVLILLYLPKIMVPLAVIDLTIIYVSFPCQFQIFSDILYPRTV